MRYFEIAKATSALHILADADPRGTTPGQPRIDGIHRQSGTSTLLKLSNPINRPSRRWHLSPQRSQ